MPQEIKKQSDIKQKGGGNGKGATEGIACDSAPALWDGQGAKHLFYEEWNKTATSQNQSWKEP